MKVSINAGGREVEVSTETDANVTIQQVATTALAVWLSCAAGGTEGPAFGLVAETAPDRAATSAGMRVGVAE